MLSKSLRCILSALVVVGLLLSSCSAETGSTVSSDQAYPGINVRASLIGSIYTQPVDPNGKLLLSSWLDPDGSDFDQYIWDNFTIQSNETITEIDWFGVYDPAKFGAGGPVIDFSVSIYPSIPAGTEPAIANPPLVQYQTGGNAGETPIGAVSGATLYAYAFSLPTSFAASAGVKYWVQIEAFQHGTSPDWCLAAGAGGDGSHFRRTAGAGGDILYRTAPGDAAFTLLGPVPDIPTDTPTETATKIPSYTPTNTPTNTPTYTVTNTPTDTPTHTPTNTLTFTPTDTFTNTPTDTPTNVATDTPTNVATDTPTYTPTATATSVPTSTATNTLMFTPTSSSTPRPLSSTPGKVNGGGKLGSEKDGVKATFGFTISYSQGDVVPKGNLTYQDHRANIRLKATSFNLLVIDGNHAWFTGSGELNDGQLVSFTVEVNALGKLGLADTFAISIPTLNEYTVSGALTGGNITIH